MKCSESGTRLQWQPRSRWGAYYITCLCGARVRAIRRANSRRAKWVVQQHDVQQHDKPLKPSQ